MTKGVKDKILETIKMFCLDPNMIWHKDIVFMWDVVYHFTYDRNALLTLIDLCIELSQKGKHIHLLAGNHDRIQEEFVYAEAQKILSLTDYPNISLYTKPTWTKIDNIDCLFFPYMHPADLDWEILKEDALGTAENDHMPTTLWSERIAKKATITLKSEVQWRRKTQKKDDNDFAVVFHHWYIANTKFPWIQGIFPFKSPALDPGILDYDDIRLISWHLHSTFSYKNYFCTWSIRATSPLEYNHQKRLFSYNPQNAKIDAYSSDILHYLQTTLHTWSKCTDETISLLWDELRQKATQFRTSNKFIVHIWSASKPDYSRLRLHIMSNDITYETLQEHIDETVLIKLNDIKIKQPSIVSWDNIEQTLHIEWAELQQRIMSWKQLLNEYLEKKYGSDVDRYKLFLEHVGL
jgi:hypothetical protein